MKPFALFAAASTVALVTAFSGSALSDARNDRDDNDYVYVNLHGFGDADTDGDGRLSKEEYLEDHNDFFHSDDDEDRLETFEEIDANNDGYLEEEEVEDYAMEKAERAMEAVNRTLGALGNALNFGGDWDDEWEDDDWDNENWDNDAEYGYRFHYELDDEEREEFEQEMEELADEMADLGEELGAIGEIVGRSVGQAFEGLDRTMMVRHRGDNGFNGKDYRERFGVDNESFVIERQYRDEIDLDSDEIAQRIEARRAEIMEAMDENGDGMIAREEFDGRSRAFTAMDSNEDGSLSLDELKVRMTLSRVIDIPRFSFARR